MRIGPSSAQVDRLDENQASAEHLGDFERR